MLFLYNCFENILVFSYLSMNGIEFLKTLPNKASQEREDIIFNAIKNEDYFPITWVPIKTTYNEYVGELFVMEHCLRLGQIEPVIVSTTAYTLTNIADHLGLLMQTTKICDLTWHNSVIKLSPTIFPANARMMTTECMKEYSLKMDKKINGEVGLVGNVGKHWVVTNKFEQKPNKSANYGWYSKSAPYTSPSGYKMWQTLGTVHNVYHVDYSQVIRLVKPTMLVNGEEMLLKDVGNDSKLCGLISDEGVIKYWSPPAVPSTNETISEDILKFNRVLKVGCIGEDVKQWQIFLNSQGASMTEDGNFGPTTKSISIDFQRKYGLGADGIVGRKTVAKANKI